MIFIILVYAICELPPPFNHLQNLQKIYKKNGAIFPRYTFED